MPVILVNGGTWGVEFESQHASGYTNASPPFDFSRTHDASVQSSVSLVQGSRIYVSQSSPLSRYTPVQSVGLGSEFISPVMEDDSDSLEIFKRVTDYLEKIGAQEDETRSGIHFHVSLRDQPVRVLKNLMRFGVFGESLIYRLGGMGRTHRGVTNDFTYCRPISNPMYVKTNDGCHALPLFNWKHLTEPSLTSIQEFWLKYGDSFYVERSGNAHYAPVRYHWLNLHPTFPGQRQRGTVEIRVWNMTLNPYYVNAALYLWKVMIKLSMQYNFQDIKKLKLTENTVYGVEEDDDSVLQKFIEWGEIPDEISQVLYVMLYRGTHLELERNKVWSHLYFSRNDTPYNFFSGNYKPAQRVESDEIETPKYVDSHNIREEGELI